MNKIVSTQKMEHLFFVWMFIFLFSSSIQAQQNEILVDIEGYNLHFSIIPGGNPPILFEPGGTFDGPLWDGTLELIHEVTGATLITYDRSGFGKSDLNPNETADEAFGIVNGIEELEKALEKLGYNKDIMLVGHSYGAFYSTLYAARHPEKVKNMVILNGQLPGYWTDVRLSNSTDPVKGEHSPGEYYLMKNFPNTIEVMRQTDIPSSIPVIDIVSGLPIFFMTDQDFEDWKQVHRDFASAQPNREGITAHGSGHYIFKDSKSLFINTVVRSYAEILDDARKLEVLSRGIDMAIKLSNEI